MLFVSTYKQALEQLPNQINSAYFLRILHFRIVILHTRPHHFDKKESNDLCASPALRSGYFQHKPGPKSMDLKSFLFFPFPGAFELLWKATVSFVISVLMEQFGFHWTDFRENWCLSSFINSAEKNLSFIKLGQEQYFTWRPILILIISLSVILRMRNFSEKTCKKSHDTHHMFKHFFFRKLCRLLDNVEK
jgi:hypothetical protein